MGATGVTGVTPLLAALIGWANAQRPSHKMRWAYMHAVNVIIGPLHSTVTPDRYTLPFQLTFQISWEKRYERSM